MPIFPSLGSWIPRNSYLAAGALNIVIAAASSSSVTTLPATAGGLAVVSATDIGTVPQDPKILGRDGGYSALFQGNSVWIYGDTFLTLPNAQNFTLISDSWSYTASLSAQNGITGFQQPVDSAGAPSMLLPETAAEQAFNQQHNVNNCQAQPCGARWALWPASIVTDPVNNQALIFYGVVSAQPGAFNFQGVGSSVATWASLTALPQRPVFAPAIVSGHPDLMFGVNDPAFGSASLISGGTLYVYGCGTPASATDKGCRLAKVDPAQAQNLSAWSYYPGNGTWSPQIARAVSVFTGDNILSVAWNSYLNLYVAVYSAPISQSVLIRSAPHPEGPWSDATLAFTAMQPASGNTYDAHAHPEYDINGGQTFFVTYSRATPAAFTSEIRLVKIQVRHASSY